ncbi:MAG: substrate-binding domain-containing protein [Vallitaleaceae bacterium]|nr:substrate-binding domain-containing protein [Vallitaleaceae bacterium]
MKLKVIGVVALCLVILSVVLMLKSQEEQRAKLETEKNAKPLVGLCVDTMVIERWQKDRDIFVSKATEAGFEVLALNANENNEKQIDQIHFLMEKKAKVIVIIPYDKNGLKDVIQEAKRAGIIVIAYDRLILNANVDAYVSFDNEKVGEYMAGYLMEAVPKGTYVIINGSEKDYNSFMFNQGYKNILNSAIERGDIKIAKEVWAPDWREDVAYDTVNELLKAGVKIDGIIGANDRLAEGAINALSEEGLAGAIPVVGHDADISACQRIVEGTQLMTVYKPIKTLAEGTVDLIVKMLEDKNLEFSESINDGKYDVPFVKFKVIPVTADNMLDTIVSDQFHNEEDIYRNIKGSEQQK